MEKAGTPGPQKVLQKLLFVAEKRTSVRVCDELCVFKTHHTSLGLIWRHRKM